MTAELPKATATATLHDRHGVGWAYFTLTGVPGATNVDIHTDSAGHRAAELWNNGEPVADPDPQLVASVLILTDLVHDASPLGVRCGLVPTQPVKVATDEQPVTCLECRGQIERLLPHLELRVTAAAITLCDAIADGLNADDATDAYYELRKQRRDLSRKLGAL